MFRYFLVLAALTAGVPQLPFLAGEATAQTAGQASVADDVGATPRELYALAEAYRLGEGVEVDLDRAKSVYETLAADGHARAWFRLGRIYLDEGRPEDALNAYQESARNGYERAHQEIAIAHARANFGSLSNQTFGFERLQELVAARRDERLLFELAEAYLYGRGTEIDLPRAHELYTELAGRDHARSHYRLGEFSRRGLLGARSPAAAADSYQAAVDHGYQKALIRLAQMQMALGRGPEALQNLERAAAAGLEDAQVLMALGHHQRTFGAASRPEEGTESLKALAEAGNLEAAEVALKLHERRSTRIRDLDLDAVLGHVEAAARAGDRRATETLASAYRELRFHVDDAHEQHAAVVDELGDQMRPSRLAVEKVHAAYDRWSPRQSWPAVLEVIRATTDDDYVRAMLALRSVDRNGLVYALQSEMKENGLYSGPVDGYLNRSVLLASLRFCKEIGAFDTCRHGPLNRDSVELISEGLAELRQ